MGAVHTFATHPKPHLDEVCAIWLFRRFGREKYPGADSAEIVVWPFGGNTPDGRSAEEWEAEGVIALGTGRGRFDHHPKTDSGIGHGSSACTAMLAAQDLGVANDPALVDALESINRNDLRGGSQPFDLSAVIKDYNNEHPDSPEMVIEWASAALDAKYEAARAFSGQYPAAADFGVDEVCAVWLKRKFEAGRSFEGGICPVKFIGPDEHEFEWSSAGYLVVHVGGKECSCDIAARVLGVIDDPALSQILDYARNSKARRGGPLELPSIIASFRAVYPDEPERAFKWCASAFDVKHEVQKLFSAAKEPYDAAVKEAAYIGGRKVMVVTVESDNPTVARYARTKEYGCNAAVVIQRNSKGQVQIYTAKRHRVRLDDVAKMLRVEEQKAKGVDCTTDFCILGSAGRVTGAEEWWYQKDGEMLLNGSFSAPDVPPTNLDLETIRHIVKLGIDSEGLPKECSAARRCVKGRDCELYCYGLDRCNKLRQEERDASVSE